MIKLIYAMPLDAHCEVVGDLDVAYALASAAENLLGSAEIAGKSGLIAGVWSHPHPHLGVFYRRLDA